MPGACQPASGSDGLGVHWQDQWVRGWTKGRAWVADEAAGKNNSDGRSNAYGRVKRYGVSTSWQPSRTFGQKPYDVCRKEKAPFANLKMVPSTPEGRPAGVSPPPAIAEQVPRTRVSMRRELDRRTPSGRKDERGNGMTVDVSPPPAITAMSPTGNDPMLADQDAAAFEEAKLVQQRETQFILQQATGSVAVGVWSA